jgi:hypothetical protein
MKSHCALTLSAHLKNLLTDIVLDESLGFCVVLVNLAEEADLQ